MAQTDIDEIRKKLLPVLERAAAGDYSKDIELDKNDSMNDIYVGIQILINTLREQLEDLQTINTQLRRLSKKYDHK